MKGLFIPDITVEMFKNRGLEGIEALMVEGELYDIEYSPAQPACEDAVSRAAILAMIEVIADCAANGHGFDYPKWKKYVESLSSVTPKQKTGRWERYHGEGESKERKCEYYDLCRNGRDENKLRESIGIAQPYQPPYIAEIESEYRKAVNMPYIKKPLAKALYEVWKKHDRDDVERKE